MRATQRPKGLSLTFFQSQDVKTAIVQFYSFEGRYGTQWSLLMASAIILAGPCP
jgi:ABC-type glycerol-3-phosphate transport system permease component